MYQSIITILIITLAILYFAFKIYKFIKKPESYSCNSSKCKTCSLNTNNECQSDDK
jgi:attachment p12 family protein